MTVETLPEPIAALVGDLVGRPSTAVPLGGMSGARVVRVVGPVGSIVVKGGVSSREASVYRSLSPVLLDAGVRIPALLGAPTLAGETYLLLEDIPAPLPRDRWLADPESLVMLHRLHRLDPAVLDALPDRFRPAWSEAMTDAVLSWLGDDPGLGRRLAGLRLEAAVLFEPRGVISGDPNPLNWGISGAGELVLMDWERIGLGHPAIDVAITMPGLPTLAEFDRVAMACQSIEPTLVTDGQPIGRHQLVLAKLWTVIELLAKTPASGDDDQGHGWGRRRRETALAVSRHMPDWLRRAT